MKLGLIIIWISIVYGSTSTTNKVLRLSLNPLSTKTSVTNRQKVVISDRCNPSVGDQWEYVPDHRDTYYIDNLGPSNQFMFKSDPNPEYMTGIGGRCSFVFMVKDGAVGSFKLRFINHFRGYQITADKTFLFNIR